MNPHSNTPQGLHLPQPAQPSMPGSPPMPASSSPTQTGHNPYAYMPPSSGQAAAGSAALPAPPSAGQSTPAYDQAVVDEADTTADEEWVARAREVAEQYQSDPYNQSRELSKIKADYLRARYNKEIKTSKDQP